MTCSTTDKKPARPYLIKLSNNIFVAILYALIGLAFSSFEYNPPSHVAIAHKVMYRAHQKILSTYKLEPCGIGDGMMGCVTTISFDFKMRQKIPHDEARKIVVGCTEILLREINTDPEIRPYLLEYPFTTKHVGIIISFTDDRDQRATYPYPSSVMVVNENIFYFYNQSSEPFDPAEEVSETYEEALAIVNADQSDTKPDIT